eukprot:TRINITY_DN4411_c0_g1_i1.p1 TRINITY_DN4411_c0_g1~~TRINITY_DN4411_c0_g1_i1.p1  ORF type:complete len:445 (-),score=107.57 TRINITY_DN4411_c0_g1_i1:90-1424(-)
MLRIFVLVCVLVALVSGKPNFRAQNAGSVDFYFDQLIDHFDPINTKTFAQRYWLNDTFWTPGKPVFFVFGGEAPLEDFYGVQSGIIVDMAQAAGAAVYYLEHRFYGQSMPTDDCNTFNMRFLSVQQALADGAAFLASLGRGPAVVFGCSYSGAMAAWFRIRYPNLVVGAVAGSGPVFAEENFIQYDETVANVLASYSSKCLSTVQVAFQNISAMAQSAAGVAQLAKDFNTCQSDFILTDIINALMGPVMGDVQYNNADTSYPAQQMCDSFAKSSGNAYEAFVQYIASQQGGDCVDTDFLTPLRNVTKEACYDGNRSWWFQTCTDFGYFQTDSHGLFNSAINLQWYLDVCTAAFGLQMDFLPNTGAINTAFGAQKPAGSNIFFTNGLQDPWANLGITSDVSDSETANVYTGGHCAPFHAPSALDPQNLIDVRNAMKKFVQNVVST